MKHLFILFLFLLCGTIISGQGQRELDSLLKILPFDKNDTNKVRHLIFISGDYCLIDAEKSLEYAKLAFETAKIIHWERGEASSLHRIGFAYYVLGNFKESVRYRLLELEKWKKLGFSEYVCTALGDIGVSYSDLGDYTTSLKYYFESNKLAEKLKLNLQVAYNLCNIASIYTVMGDLNKALEYHDKSLKISEKYNYQDIMADNKANIGNIYIEKKYLGLAIKYLNEALIIYKTLNDKNNLSAVLSNIAAIYVQQSDSAGESGNIPLKKSKAKEALDTYFNALRIAEEVNNEFYICNFSGNIGSIYLEADQTQEAEKYLNKGLEIALKINSPEEVVCAYERLYALKKKTGNYADALLFLEKFKNLNDSLNSVENNSRLSEILAKYETDKKDSENKYLSVLNEEQSVKISYQNTLLFALVFGIIAVILLGGMLIYQNRLRLKNQTAVSEQKLLRSQMNPHFIFNCLTNIESFIYEHQPKEAGLYLNRFAKLIRMILENSNTEYISLKKEIEFLQYYLELQKLRLGEKLTFEIIADEIKHPEEIMVPPMLTQPFIENSIEHGMQGIPGAGKVQVTFRIIEGSLDILVKDNGRGFCENPENKNSGRKPMAINVTKERIRLLNRNRRHKLTFSIDTNNNNDEFSGTVIRFAIPLKPLK